MKKNHSHTCEACGELFECLDPKPADKCWTAKAVRANKQGPFCGLCRHLFMAKRYADLRGVELEATIDGVKKKLAPAEEAY